MKAAGALILLLCCLSEARAQAQGGPPGPNTPELWDEVKQLRDMVHGMGNTVIVQGEKLKTMEAKLTASEAEGQELRDTVVEQGNTLKNVEEDAKEQRDLVTDLRMELAINKYQMKGMAK